MSIAEHAPCLAALAKHLGSLQAALNRQGHGSDKLSILIPRKLGERLEAELMHTNRAAWAPLTGGIEIHAEGQLKQITLCETFAIGWKLGPFKERKPNNEQSHRENGDRS
jgi:hypothetical protein